MLLLLFKTVHLCSPTIFNYRLKYTQNIIQLLQVSIVLLLLSSNTFTEGARVSLEKRLL